MTTAVLLQAFWLVFDPYVLLVIMCSARFGRASFRTGVQTCALPIFVDAHSVVRKDIYDHCSFTASLLAGV